jgi:hypothetical protein
VIAPAVLGHHDAHSRALAPVFQLDLGQAEQDARYHPAQTVGSAGLVNLGTADTRKATISKGFSQILVRVFVLCGKTPIHALPRIVPSFCPANFVKKCARSKPG